MIASRQRRCGNSDRDPSIVVAASIWAAMYLVALLVIRYAPIAAHLKILIGVAPLLPLAIFAIRWISHLRQMGELERRLHLDALSNAFPDWSATFELIDSLLEPLTIWFAALHPFRLPVAGALLLRRALRRWINAATKHF